mgnify:CR=1 FL=1
MAREAKYYHNVHQELIDLCQEHDQSAQKQVYKLYYKAMFNTALNVIRDQHKAEDIMQEAFLKAFRKIHLYNNTSSFGAWLKRIVINESINEIRKNKPEYITDETYFFEGEDEHHVEEAKPLHFDWGNANVSKVKTAYSQLSKRYRTVISLLLLEGYDLEETAQIMDVTYGNARVLYMRAKNKLQDLVKREYEEV